MCCSFGWPFGYSASAAPQSSSENHKGVLEQESFEYLQKEIDSGAIIGPFEIIIGYSPS